MDGTSPSFIHAKCSEARRKSGVVRRYRARLILSRNRDRIVVEGLDQGDRSADDFFPAKVTTAVDHPVAGKPADQPDENRYDHKELHRAPRWNARESRFGRRVKMKFTRFASIHDSDGLRQSAGLVRIPACIEGID